METENNTPQVDVEVNQTASQEPATEVAQEVTPEVTPTVETTETGAQEPPKEDTYVYTYKSKEEAEKGIKAKDEYIEKLKQEKIEAEKAKIEILEKMGFKDNIQLENAQVQSKLTQQYQNDTQIIENAYKQDVTALNFALDQGQMSEYDYNNQLANLQQMKLDYLSTAKANDQIRRQQAQQDLTNKQKQALEQQKTSLYEQHQAHKDIIDLFYDPQPTLEKAIAMKNAIANQAIEAYKASLQASQENADARGNLSSVVTSTNGQTTKEPFPTTWNEILSKGTDWYNKNYDTIQKLKAEDKIR